MRIIEKLEIWKNNLSSVNPLRSLSWQLKRRQDSFWPTYHQSHHPELVPEPFQSQWLKTLSSTTPFWFLALQKNSTTSKCPVSSVGRAEDWKSSCRRFDSAPGHHLKMPTTASVFLCLKVCPGYFLFIESFILEVQVIQQTGYNHRLPETYPAIDNG